MKSRPAAALTLSALIAGACALDAGPQAAPAPKATVAPPQAPAGAASTATAPAAAPKIVDPRTEALIAWLEGFFPWGAGETVVDDLGVKIPGYRFIRAKKSYTAEPRMNDQTFAALDDDGKSAIVGDAFADEARMKAPQPVRTDADLAGIKAQVETYLRGRFKIALDPAHDRKGWKGFLVQPDTGYGYYAIQGWVKADDGSVAILGRVWDRQRSIPEQRKELIKIGPQTPVMGPADARVTVVEYSDMQCGYCKKRTADWEPLAEKLGKELKIKRYFKMFPLVTEHPWAFRAASAGLCFFDKDPKQFLRWKSNVYARQEEMNVPALDTFALDFAVAGGVPEQEFKDCYLQSKISNRILADITEGFSVRVRSTPTYFIDGVMISWFQDNMMEEYLRKTFLKGAGLPLPTPVATKAAAAPAAPKAPAH